jgi:NNP family nitrate/nitrite transporter-like MFS transporter
LLKTNYKWFILVLAMLAYGIVTGADRMTIPVLFKEISLDLNLNMVSIGTIWGMDPLAGVFVCMLGGLLADRFGIKRTLVAACILSGIFCALRGFSNNFISMAATMFLFGLVNSITFTVAPKIAAVWFNGKHLTLANSLMMMSMAVFSMASTMLSATVLSPWLGGWRNVLFFMGAPAVLIGILWWIFGREPRKGEIPGAIVTTVPLKEAFLQVVRIKQVWIFGLIQFCFMGSMTGMGGYLAIYLRDIGWSAVAADTALTVTSATGIIGVIPMVMLASRLRSPRGMFIFSMMIIVATLVLIPFVSDTWFWVLIIGGGLLRAAGPALANTLIFSIKGVGGTYAGTALGLATTLGMLGAFAAPPLGNKLAGINPGMPFVFWSILAALSLPLFLLLRESKPRESNLSPVDGNIG